MNRTRLNRAVAARCTIVPGSSNPAPKFALYDMGQHADARIAVVETRDEGEFLSAMLEEDLFILLRDLFQRLDAIRDEARCQDGDPLDPLARQSLDRLVGISLEPLCPAESRLKGETESLLVETKSFSQCVRRHLALGLIGIALVDIALRQPMERGEDDL